MSNEAEIAKLVGVLVATFPNTNVTDATIEAYVHMLKDLPLDVLRSSVEQSLAESKFFPTIAEIRNQALALTMPKRRDPMDAWGEVVKAISKVGFYNSPTFDDPLITRAVEALGWKYLCSSENIVADRAHFAKLYEQFVQREIEDARLLPAARNMRDLLTGAIKEIGDGRGF